MTEIVKSCLAPSASAALAFPPAFRSDFASYPPSYPPLLSYPAAASPTGYPQVQYPPASVSQGYSGYPSYPPAHYQHTTPVTPQGYSGFPMNQVQNNLPQSYQSPFLAASPQGNPGQYLHPAASQCHSGYSGYPPAHYQHTPVTPQGYSGFPMNQVPNSSQRSYHYPSNNFPTLPGPDGSYNRR